MNSLLLISILVTLALIFDFLNGFHDSANVVATMIASRAMTPRAALLIAAAANFIGPFLFGVAVAETVGNAVVKAEIRNHRSCAGSFGKCQFMEPDHLVFWYSIQLFTRFDWRDYWRCACRIWISGHSTRRTLDCRDSTIFLTNYRVCCRVACHAGHVDGCQGSNAKSKYILQDRPNTNCHWTCSQPWHK